MSWLGIKSTHQRDERGDDESQHRLEKKHDKAKIQRLERELQDTKNARQYENGLLQTYLRNAGVFDDKYNAHDQMLRYCDDLVDERNRFKKQLDMETSKFRGQMQNRELELQAATDRAKMYKSEYDHAKTKDEQLRRQLAEADQQRNEHRRQLDELAWNHDRALQAAEQLSAHTIDQLSVVHQQEKAQLKGQLVELQQRMDWELRSQNDHRNQEMAEVTHRHATELQDQRNEHLNALAKLMVDRDEIAIADKQHIKDLEDDLLSQADDFRPATDQALKSKFNNLKSIIARVTLPSNLRMQGDTAMLPTTLDDQHGSYTDFLNRHRHDKNDDGNNKNKPKNNLRFVLSSLFWDVLLRAFFAVPFGFGYLGEPGQQQLLGMYDNWLRLYGGTSKPESWGTRLAVFKDDFHANKCRSAMFLSLLAAMKAGKQPEGIAAQLYQEHKKKVESELYDILAVLTAYNVGDDVKVELPRIVDTAAELALEIGVQRAQVGLSVPMPGHIVTIGDEFHDHRDGAVPKFKGKEYRVDLLVTPGLFRVGNGRGDMWTSRTLVPAEVFRVDEAVDPGDQGPRYIAGLFAGLSPNEAR